MAEDLGDQDKAKQIQDQLNELEERAEALDRQRTKNISAIRCVTEPASIGPLSSAHAPCHNSQADLCILCYTGSTSHGGRLSSSLPPFKPTDSSPYLPPSYINQRNREWNIVESEKALVVSKTALSGSWKVILINKMIWNPLNILLEFIFKITEIMYSLNIYVLSLCIYIHRYNLLIYAEKQQSSALLFIQP